MKPENIKKVWEHYRGYQIRYRLWRSQYIVDAFNKNMNGDFSPSQFYNPIESRVHLIVQEYIKYLLEQEALEQKQDEQLIVDSQHKAQRETKNRTQTTTPIEKTQKEQPQEPKARKTHNSPPIPRKGGVARSDEEVKVHDCENHRNVARSARVVSRRLRLKGLKPTKVIAGNEVRAPNGG